MLVFVLFMIGMATRNVTSSALVSKIPHPQERAGFMALLSSVQSMFQGLGALCASMMLTEIPGVRLEGMQEVTVLSMLCFLLSLTAMFKIERILRARTIASA